MSSSPLPEPERWDGRAPVEDVRRWLEALRERPNGAESRLLGQLCDPGAAPVLREYVEDPNSHVAAAAMRALGCCGDASHDGPRLLAMARSTSSPSAALLSTLTELEVPGSVEVFRGLLRRAEPGGREEVELLDRLVWLRDSGVADRILELVRERGFETVLHMSRRLAWAVFRVGNDHHRAELVELAVDAGRRFVGVDLADPESQQIYHLARRQWESYERFALVGLPLATCKVVDLLRLGVGEVHSDETPTCVHRELHEFRPMMIVSDTEDRPGQSAGHVEHGLETALTDQLEDAISDTAVAEPDQTVEQLHLLPAARLCPSQKASEHLDGARDLELSQRAQKRRGWAARRAGHREQARAVVRGIATAPQGPHRRRRHMRVRVFDVLTQDGCGTGVAELS